MKFLLLAASVLAGITHAQNSTSSSTAAIVRTSAAPTLQSATVSSNVLVIAKDAYSSTQATAGLNGYGIPFTVLIVPQAGTSLPALNSSAGGNFGGIFIAGQVAYDYGGTTGWQSALTTAQWNQLYDYQTTYGVRMVQVDVYPGPNFGSTALGGCCGSGVEQLMSFSNTDQFAQAGIKKGAGFSTKGLYHYPASITNTTTTTEIAQFAASSDGGFSSVSTAGVINNFNGRQQMVFFMGFATDWSATSNFVHHAWITWMTRGLYAGYRRVYLNTQIDDVLLDTDLYYPANTTYRLTTSDMNVIANWVGTIQSQMNTGSYYRPELGHNGDGSIQYACYKAPGDNYDTCAGGPIEDTIGDSTPLEFKKVVGTGVSQWPTTPAKFVWTSQCYNKDPLTVWFQTTSNRDKFMHISHTFTHESLNNATYSDALHEIQFNQQAMQTYGISNGNFTANGLIPPAITGLHNGDVLKAWKDAGLTHCVGDNTRPVLRNTNNQMWPYITNVANDGFDGITVIPRFSTRIYFNCDSAECTTREWINTSAGSGTFDDLLAVEKSDTMRRLFGLYHDGYMFHQANMRNQGLPAVNVNGQSKQTSIFQAWVETMVAEFTRLVNWPMQTLKQSDLAIAFQQRQARDACNYSMTWNFANKKITGVTVSSNGNSCSAAIPLTVPGPVTNTKGFPLEKIGNDPLTIWVKLTGAAQTFTLSTPISW